MDDDADRMPLSPLSLLFVFATAVDEDAFRIDATLVSDAQSGILAFRFTIDGYIMVYCNDSFLALYIKLGLLPHNRRVIHVYKYYNKRYIYILSKYDKYGRNILGLLLGIATFSFIRIRCVIDHGVS